MPEIQIYAPTLEDAITKVRDTLASKEPKARKILIKFSSITIDLTKIRQPELYVFTYVLYY